MSQEVTLNRTSLLGIFVIGAIVFSISGCVTHNPGNPEHAWLNGIWEGKGTGDRPMRLELRVVNGNELIGRVGWWRDNRRIATMWVYDGVIAGGTIDGGEKIRINLEVRWTGSGTTSFYQITYYPEDQSFRGSGIYLTKLNAN